MPNNRQDEVIYYVAQNGDDKWSGERATPAKDKSDGPFATIQRAQRAARKHLRKKQSPTVRIEIREGTYFLKKPIVLTEKDSGWFSMRKFAQEEEHHPLVFAGYKRERPIISGGRRIENWTVGEHKGLGVWKAKLPSVKRGKWNFTQLWVNGERRHRPVLPREGEFASELMDDNWEGGWTETVRSGTNRFGFEEGDIDPNWTNLRDVEIEFRTLWVTERGKLKKVDVKNQIAYMDRTSNYRLSYDFHQKGANYVAHNVFEALEEPGQWYLDRAEGVLYYLPMEGEDPKKTEVVAPVLDEVVRLEGNFDEKTPVETVRFENLTFAHNEWDTPDDHSGSIQAAHDMPGLVNISYGKNIVFDRCRIEHAGTYAVHGEKQCMDVAFRRCTMTDMGAGGVKMWHGCTRTLVEDCRIHDGGIIDASGVGVLMARSSGNRILHNHIHDFYYTAVSLGWCWNYGPNDTFGNIVEWNHIHDIGKGRLSDMAGIYTLGVQPGTRLRYNHIHHVRARSYGGSGIYPDEASSHVLIESNLIHDTNGSAFFQHYGGENMVRNNILAFDDHSHVMCQWEEEHISFYFENNIVYLGKGILFHTKMNWAPKPGNFRDNIYYSAGGGKLAFDKMSLAQLRKKGYDVGGVEEDPGFQNAAKRDFRLKKNSPALKMGFVPWDYSEAGPREEE
jgi:hypothetical protein